MTTSNEKTQHIADSIAVMKHALEMNKRGYFREPNTLRKQFPFEEDDEVSADCAWPARGQITAEVGLWCFGCGHKLWRKGTAPTAWIETLCSRPGCPADDVIKGVSK